MSIKINCKVKVKNNFKKIEEIQKKLPQMAEEILKEVLKNIQGYAIKLENGHNSKGILVEMVETSTMTAKGRVYADPNKFVTDDGQFYLWFEYFGTRTVCRATTHRKNETFY